MSLYPTRGQLQRLSFLQTAPFCRPLGLKFSPPVAISERPHTEAQGAASNWSAQKVREEEAFADAFDAVGATEAGRPVMFTGESVFPWMLEVS